LGKIASGWRDNLGSQVVYEGLLRRARANCKQRLEVFIKQIPLEFETIYTAGRFFFVNKALTLAAYRTSIAKDFIPSVESHKIVSIEL
jgi:hypothetical protein